MANQELEDARRQAAQTSTPAQPLSPDSPTPQPSPAPAGPRPGGSMAPPSISEPQGSLVAPEDRITRDPTEQPGGGYGDDQANLDRGVLDWPTDVGRRQPDSDPFARFSGVKEVERFGGYAAGEALKGAVDAPVVGGILQALGWAYGETVDPLLGMIEMKASGQDSEAQAAYDEYRKTLEGDQASALDYFATTRGLRAAHQVTQDEASRIANDPRQPAVIRAMAGAQNIADVVAQNALPVPGVGEAAGLAGKAVKGAAGAAGEAIGKAAKPGAEAFASSGEREAKVVAGAKARAAQIKALDDTQLAVLSETSPDAAMKADASKEIVRRAQESAKKQTEAAQNAAAQLRENGRGAEASAVERDIAKADASFDAMINETGGPTDPTPKGVAKKGKPGEMDTSGVRTPATTGKGVPVTHSPAFKKFLDLVPQQVRDDIQASVAKNIDAVETQRRGTQSIAAINARAKQVGLDVRNLSQVAPGTAATAEEMRAVLDGYVKSVSRRQAISAKIKEAGVFATDGDKARFVVASYEENILQRVALGYRAEIGRGMRILREFHDGEAAGKVQDTYSRVLKQIGGAKNAEELMGKLYDIEMNPTFTALEKKFKQAKLMEHMSDSNFWDKLNENFINAILSNPATHVANMAGQTALHEMDVLSQIPAAAWDSVAAKLTGRGRERTFSGAIAGAVMGHRSVARATMESLLYLKEGISAEDITHFEMGGQSPLRAHAIGGKAGAVINLPTRGLGAEDVFFFRNGYQRQLGMDASNAVATRKGAPPITSPRFWEEVGAIMDQPTPEMLAKAREAGKRAGLRQDAGAVSDALMTVRDLKVPGSVPLVGGMRPGGFIAPFIRIGFNLARVGAEYSPFGYARMFTTKAGERADVFGRATVGSALWYLMWQKADQGDLTGAAPSDPTERAAFYNAGKQPYAMRIGNQWHRYDRLEPIASSLRWVTGINEAAKELSADPLNAGLYASTIGKSIGTIAQGLLSSSFVQDITTFTDIWNGPPDQAPERMQKYAARLAASNILFSGALRGAAGVIDPFQRNPKNIVEQIEAGLPGLSQNVAPYLDNYGEPEQRPESKQGIGSVLNPIASTTDKGMDPVDAELAKHEVPAGIDAQGNPLPVKQLFAGLARVDAGKYKLAPDEGFMLQQTAGRAAHQSLTRLFAGQQTYQGKTYKELDEPTKIKAIQKTIADARATGRQVVADAMIHSGEAGKVSRGAAMRVALAPTQRDRAEVLGGLSAQGHLDAAARRFINADLPKDGPTIDEYVKAAPFVSQYLSLRPFLKGNPAEWERLKQERADYSKALQKDPRAPMPPLVRAYQSAENPARALLANKKENDAHRHMVDGATYDWQP